MFIYSYSSITCVDFNSFTLGILESTHRNHAIVRSKNEAKTKRYEDCHQQRKESLYRRLEVTHFQVWIFKKGRYIRVCIIDSPHGFTGDNCKTWYLNEVYVFMYYDLLTTTIFPQKMFAFLTGGHCSQV